MDDKDKNDRPSIAERILRLQDEWDAIAAETDDLELTPEQLREAQRRLADHKENPDRTVPWEDVDAELLALLRHARP